jgi:dTDP-4-amino-4,6-dideoxygalactose transaminase
MGRSVMQVPLVDLQAQYATIKNEIDEAISKVISCGDFILGSEVKRFEEAVAAYCGTRYAVGVASGTDALHLALLACGIGTGDEVITTPFTFIATAEAIIHCGARPVFVDIEPYTYNLDCNRVEAHISDRTRAILPVHLYGHPVDTDPLLTLARRYNIKVVEDCAQALGARYKGRPVGTMGNAGCFSFFPSKTLGAYGDGGMVVTSDLEVAEKVGILRQHGAYHKYYHLVPGFNSRLDTLQAAILRVKLQYLDSWINQRRLKAAMYASLLSDVPGIDLPVEEPYAQHAFNYYTIRIRKSNSERDRLAYELAAQGIATAIYYPLSLHLQDALKYLGYGPGDFPESEQAQGEVLSLPMFPELQPDQVTRVAQTIKHVVNRDRRRLTPSSQETP